MPPICPIMCPKMPPIFPPIFPTLPPMDMWTVCKSTKNMDYCIGPKNAGQGLGGRLILKKERKK